MSNSQHVKEMETSLEELVQEATQALEELEEKYAAKAIGIIEEMKSNTGYGIDSNFETGIDDLDKALIDFANEWDCFRWDVDVIADEVAE